MTIVNKVETAIALTGIAVFAVLGNAAALVAGLPRRYVQAALLLTFCGLLAVTGTRMGRRVKPFVTRRVQWVLTLGVGLALLPVGIALAAGQRPATYAIVAAVLTSAWLTLLLYHLTGRGNGKAFKSTAKTSSQPPFDLAIVVVLTLLAFVAYFKGPDPGEPTMAFRGSTTQAGTSAAVLAAIALAVLQGWQRFVGVLLSVYMNFVAASRTGLLVLVVLTAIVLVMQAANETGSLLSATRAFMKDLVFFTACAAIVVLPSASAHFYPYASSRPAPIGAHIQYKDRLLTDREGLAFRYKRLLRLARPPVMIPDLPVAEIRRLDEEGIAESRWVLVQKSLRAIAAGPFGYWPRAFESQTRIYCGRPELCAYPHNILLEVGYHFGWLPFGTMILGLAVLGVRAILTVMHPDVLVRVSSIGFLGHLGFAQVSGNLLDHSLALALGIIWTATQARSDTMQGTGGP